MRLLPLALSALLTAPAFAQAGMNTMMGGAGDMANVKIVDDNDPFVPNAFTGSFRMEMHTTKNGNGAKEEVTNMSYWSSPDKTLIAFTGEAGKQPAMRVLTDLKGKWTYMLMNDESGMKSGMKSRKKKVIYTGDEKADPATVKKTGETKVIEGHTCTKYTGTNEVGAWTAWVAPDIQINLGEMMGSFNSGRSDAGQWKEFKGMPLEMETTDATDKTRTVFYIKDLKMGPVDDTVFSLDGYHIMEIAMPDMGR